MIKENDKYTYTLDNDGIRRVSNISLTDAECEIIAGKVAAEIDGIVRKAAMEYRTMHPVEHPGIPKVMAYVSLQKWVHDYALEVEEVCFDCASALNEFRLDELPEDGNFIRSGCCNCGDDVFYESVRKCLVKDWDGPFSFYIEDEDEYVEYIEARKALEA